MYDESHYLSKIRRNRELLDKVSEEKRVQYIKNIEWGTELSSRLDLLDYNEREIGIANLHRVLDNDYNEMVNAKEHYHQFGVK